MAKQVASQRSSEAPASGARKRSRSKAPPAAESNVAPAPVAAPYEPSYEEIAQRAYGLYLERGAHDGDAFADWVRAEHELRTSH